MTKAGNGRRPRRKHYAREGDWLAAMLAWLEPFDQGERIHRFRKHDASPGTLRARARALLARGHLTPELERELDELIDRYIAARAVRRLKERNRR